MEAQTVKFLVMVSSFSVRRPLVTIFSCMAFALLCALGVLNVSVETASHKLWQDQHSYIQDNMEYVVDTFPDQYYSIRFVMLGEHDNSNVLTLSALNSMFDIWEELTAVTNGGTTFPDVCRLTSAGCATSGLLRFFKNNRTYYESVVLTQSDLLVALSADRYPDGAPFDRTIVFGQWTESNGIGQSATLVRFDVWVSDRDWAKAALNTFVDQDEQMITRKWPGVRVGIFTTFSVDEELARSVSGDVSLFSMAFVLMSTLTAVLLGRPLDPVKGRRLLGMMDYLVVCFAVLAGYGISMLFGVPFTVLQQALPFILVGIGMDDAFVIVGCFDQTDLSLSIEERMAETMKRVGMSVTLTSLTDIVAFILATSSAFPAVQYFGIYAAFSCFFVWFFHISAFVSLLALDARRQGANRYDCLFCVEARAAPEPTGARSPYSNLAGRLLGAVLRKLTGHLLVQVLVALVFVAIGAVSLWQTLIGLSTNFRLTDLAPDESYVRDFLMLEKSAFSADTFGQAVPVGLIFPDTNHGSASVQAAMLEAYEEAKLLKWSRSEQQPSWLHDFTAWALTAGLAEGIVDEGDFENADDCTDVNGIGCRFVVGDALAPAVAHFISLEVGEFRADEVVFDSSGTRIISSAITFRLVDMDDSKEMVMALEEIEDWVESYQTKLPGMMAHATQFGFWDQFRIIVHELLRSIGLCMASVVVLTAVVLKSTRAVFLVLITLLLVFCDLVGSIMLWGLDLNSISMINLLMAVGLVVDYSMHVAHCFCMQDGSLTRRERVVKAMEEIGGAVLLGVGSTFVAILPLSLAGSEVFRVFFKMFLSITVVGGLHGMVFLPVMLSLFGPSSTPISVEVKNEIVVISPDPS